eukprot:4448403-Amphidinium_carterae.4
MVWKINVKAPFWSTPLHRSASAIFIQIEHQLVEALSVPRESLIRHASRNLQGRDHIQNDATQLVDAKWRSTLLSHSKNSV